jgi:hypothetical protein
MRMNNQNIAITNKNRNMKNFKYTEIVTWGWLMIYSFHFLVNSLSNIFPIILNAIISEIKK